MHQARERRFTHTTGSIQQGMQAAWWIEHGGLGLLNSYLQAFIAANQSVKTGRDGANLYCSFDRRWLAWLADHAQRRLLRRLGGNFCGGMRGRRDNRRTWALKRRFAPMPSLIHLRRKKHVGLGSA